MWDYYLSMTQSAPKSNPAAVARARKLWEAVRDGKTIFFHTGTGWDIIGPAHLIVPGAEITVTKADKSTQRVVVVDVRAERTVDGVATRTATFRDVPAGPAVTHAEPARPWFPVRDRQAAAVGGMLGLASSAPLGYCHYCGLELDRKGNCGECR